MILEKEKKLLELNKLGWLVAPNEDENSFLKRVEITRKNFQERQFGFPYKNENKILDFEFNWTRAKLLDLFDVAPYDFVGFFVNEKLSFFEGGVTWVVSKGDVLVPFVQLRKNFQNKRKHFLGYSIDEILSHEMVHAIRAPFGDSEMEEFFAYLTSSSSIRKIFGPIIKNRTEIFLFFTLFFGSLVFDFLDFFIFSFIFSLSTILLVFSGFFRLFLLRRKISKTFNKLNSILKDKKRAKFVLFRLTDEEIFYFSKVSKEKILKYVEEQKELRWKVIKLSYFIDDFA